MSAHGSGSGPRATPRLASAARLSLAPSVSAVVVSALYFLPTANHASRTALIYYSVCSRHFLAARHLFARRHTKLSERESWGCGLCVGGFRTCNPPPFPASCNVGCMWSCPLHSPVDLDSQFIWTFSNGLLVVQRAGQCSDFQLPTSPPPPSLHPHTGPPRAYSASHPTVFLISLW